MRLKISRVLSDKSTMNGMEALALIFKLTQERYPEVSREAAVTAVSLAFYELKEKGLPVTAENLEKELLKAADDYLVASGNKSA